MLDRLNFLEGTITYDNFSWINSSNIYLDHLEDLSEDLLQVTFFDERYILDVGWYPEFNANGQFILQVIYNYNWEKPFYIEKTKDLQILMDSIHKAIALIHSSK